MTLSKHEISEYYADPAVRAAILSQINGRSVMTVQDHGDKKVRRRNAPSGGAIRILQAMNNASNKNDLAWYTDRRHAEFHPTLGKKTRQAFVDIDPGPSRSFESLKPVVVDVENALNSLPEVKDTSITYSGGRGFHVRGNLRKKMKTDDIRQIINTHLEGLNIEKVVARKPKGDEVRLDTSTLKNKGSIRAEYSLNADTGRVAVPLTQRELRGFSPEQAEVSRILKEKEFAPGIPRSKRVYSIPEKAVGQQWTMAVQEHNAQKAGRHWDLRLVDPATGFAHSWAVPKATFPEEKQKLLAVRTPTHTAHYALNFGDKEERQIGKGYGKGTVKIVHKEPVKMLQTENNKVKFERIIGDEKEQYQMFRTKDDKWLLRKVGSELRDAYQEGHSDALAKLGLDGSNMSTSEQRQPLEIGDDNTPAGGLAAALSGMADDDAKMLEPPHENTGEGVEARLNKETSWTNPVQIPSSYMNGATQPMPGGGR